MNEFFNVLLPKFFFDYMRHWSAKQVKWMLFAVTDFAFNGVEPTFDEFDEESNKKMEQHFNVVRDYVAKSQKNYKVKAMMSKQKVG